LQISIIALCGLVTLLDCSISQIEYAHTVRTLPSKFGLANPDKDCAT
jgi:hypothetical protein